MKGIMHCCCGTECALQTASVPIAQRTGAHSVTNVSTHEPAVVDYGREDNFTLDHQTLRRSDNTPLLAMIGFLGSTCMATASMAITANIPRSTQLDGAFTTGIFGTIIAATALALVAADRPHEHRVVLCLRVALIMLSSASTIASSAFIVIGTQSWEVAIPVIVVGAMAVGVAAWHVSISVFR